MDHTRSAVPFSLRRNKEEWDNVNEQLHSVQKKEKAGTHSQEIKTNEASRLAGRFSTSKTNMIQAKSLIQRQAKDDGTDPFADLGKHLDSKEWQLEKKNLASEYIKSHDLQEIGSALAGVCLLKKDTLVRAFTDVSLEIIDQLDKNSKGDVSLIAGSHLTDAQLETSSPGLLVKMHQSIEGGWSTKAVQHFPLQRTRIANAIPMAFINKKGPLTPEEIATARIYIAKITDKSKQGDLYEKLQEKPAYASQRDNKYEKTVTVKGKTKKVKVEDEGGQMCNLTSLAMCLSYLGISNPHPEMQYEDALEKVRVDNNYPARDTSDGWGKVAEHMGVDHKIFAWNKKEGYDWYNTNVREAHLRNGDAVMMSIHGHIVRVQAVTAAGLIVDDPYGKSKLNAGEGRSFSTRNKSEWNSKNEGAANEGENNLWDWDTVKSHDMFWLAYFRKK